MLQSYLIYLILLYKILIRNDDGVNNAVNFISDGFVVFHYSFARIPLCCMELFFQLLLKWAASLQQPGHNIKALFIWRGLSSS